MVLWLTLEASELDATTDLDQFIVVYLIGQ